MFLNIHNISTFMLILSLSLPVFDRLNVLLELVVQFFFCILSKCQSLTNSKGVLCVFSAGSQSCCGEACRGGPSPRQTHFQWQVSVCVLQLLWVDMGIYIYLISSCKLISYLKSYSNIGLCKKIIKIYYDKAFS